MVTASAAIPGSWGRKMRRSMKANFNRDRICSENTRGYTIEEPTEEWGPIPSITYLKSNAPTGTWPEVRGWAGCMFARILPVWACLGTSERIYVDIASPGHVSSLQMRTARACIAPLLGIFIASTGCGSGDFNEDKVKSILE